MHALDVERYIPEDVAERINFSTVQRDWLKQAVDTLHEPDSRRCVMRFEHLAVLHPENMHEHQPWLLSEWRVKMDTKLWLPLTRVGKTVIMALNLEHTYAKTA